MDAVEVKGVVRFVEDEEEVEGDGSRFDGFLELEALDLDHLAGVDRDYFELVVEEEEYLTIESLFFYSCDACFVVKREVMVL